MISHNVETVKRLTPVIRTKAKYDRSLEVLRYISDTGQYSQIRLYVRTRRNEEEVTQTINDLYDSGCKILTIGQYLQPLSGYMDVVEYITAGKI